MSSPADPDYFFVQYTEIGLASHPETCASGECGLKAEGVTDVGWLISKARRLIEAGVEIIMIESEGITEDVAEWRTDIPAQIIAELGLEHVMFEAADPKVFEWYVKTYGNEVNLFVDHSQILQLEALRQGIWGLKSTWRRVHNF